MSVFFRNLICLTGFILCLQLQLLHVANSMTQEPRRTEDLLCTHVLSTQLLEKCCGNSTPSNLFYESSNCNTYGENLTACRYECLFKHWGMVATDKSLDMPNVTKMINSLFGKESEYFSYGEVLKTSYGECNNLGNIFGDLTAVFNAPLQTYYNDSEKCNNVAMLYNKCAASKTFLSCPSANWQETNIDCQLGLQVLTGCVSFFKDQPISPRKQSARSGATSFKLSFRNRQANMPWYASFFKWLIF